MSYDDDIIYDPECSGPPWEFFSCYIDDTRPCSLCEQPTRRAVFCTTDQHGHPVQPHGVYQCHECAECAAR